MRQAALYYKDFLAGTLTETDEGEYVFQYDDKYIGEHPKESITLTMDVPIKA
jgi:serine/threonine-protein kinase HipA